MEMDQERLWFRLNKLLLRAPISISQVAREAGMNQKTVWNFYVGMRPFRLKNYIKLDNWCSEQERLTKEPIN